MDDMISRQAAIDEMRKCRFVVDAIEKIRGLPSAEPEIIRCKDCKWWDFTPDNTILPDWHRCRCFGKIHTRYEDFCSRGERRAE